MSILAHLSTLHQKHAQLDDQINEAYNSHFPDYVISELKKKKLRIKEEISTFDNMPSMSAPNKLAA